MAWYKCPKAEEPIELVPWNTGTDEQITRMVEGYYAGKVTLAQIQSVWHLGDTRTVSLSAMSQYSPYLSDTHAAQDVEFMIVNWGGKKLSNNKDCLAIVHQKNSLAEAGAMSHSASYVNYTSWSSCLRRNWCNDTYRNAIPQSIRSIFKEFKNSSYSGSSIVTSNDYFAIASEKEVLGTNTYSLAETNDTQFAYYVNDIWNRQKKQGSSGRISEYWTRSVRSGEPSYCVYINYQGNSSDASNARYANGIAPFGCI